MDVAMRSAASSRMGFSAERRPRTMGPAGVARTVHTQHVVASLISTMSAESLDKVRIRRKVLLTY